MSGVKSWVVILAKEFEMTNYVSKQSSSKMDNIYAEISNISDKVT